MAKNDNPHALRLLESMSKHGKDTEATEFAEATPLAKSADFNKKYEWAQNVCTFLDENFDDETVKAKGIATKMIDKLKSTMSTYDSEGLDRSVLGINIAKAENKKILYNVNIIQEALSKGVQISFDYMGWDKHKKLVKKSERRYNMNPWALIWANDRYYLYGYDVKKTGDVFNERNYRVDKLDNIQLSDIPRDGKTQYRSFNANTYVSRRMGMFSGKEQAITVRIPEYLIGAFIDQFGKRIAISEESEDVLLVTFYAVPSVILLGWLVGLKVSEVVEPPNVREDIINLLQQNMNLYNKKN